MGGPIIAAGLGAPAGIFGMLSTLATFNATSGSLFDDMLGEISANLRGGETFLAAPGFTGVFGASPTLGDFGQQSWLFPSDVVFGWSPPSTNGGLIVDQFQFADVFAKRPAAFAQDPTGHRAIMPFFQTGNFGYLDLDLQTALRNPSLAGQPTRMFQAFVAMTPALKLDNHLWPSRGVFSSGGSLVPSPDESLLYPWQAEYAQNGRFAVASHVGVGDPRTIDATIPDFVNDTNARTAMEELGGFSAGASMSIVDDGQSLTVSPGQEVTLHRGGGGISIIDDAAIRADIGLNAQTSVPSAVGGPSRPYFSSEPIGASAVSHVFSYDGPATTGRFYEPRGIAIQPFVFVESPRFGDRVNLGTSLVIHWRDRRPIGYSIEIRDANGNLLDTTKDALTSDQETSHTLSVSIARLFQNLAPSHPIDRSVYRISISMSIDAATQLSTTSLDVVFEK
jgi:hypothetical protein